MSVLGKDLDYSLNGYVGRNISLLLILTLIYQDKEHTGYSLTTKIKQMTDGKIILLVGTVYPQLEKLEQENLIEKEIKNEQSRSKDVIRQKSVFKITTKGIKTIQKIWSEWDDFIELIDKFRNKHYFEG